MKNTTLILLAAAAMPLMAACAPTVTNHGNMVKDYQMVTLHPGTSSKSDVLRALGSPTTQDPFNDNTWLYIGQVTEKKGILDPKVTEERIVMIDFDEEGIMEAIEDAGGNREYIPLERRKTPTSGNEVTMMQQFFGNLGRFNGQGLPSASHSGGNN